MFLIDSDLQVGNALLSIRPSSRGFIEQNLMVCVLIPTFRLFKLNLTVITSTTCASS